MSLRFPHHPRRRPSAFAPRVECLEDRCVPTCTTTQFGGILTIRGTFRADTVNIGDDGAGNLSLLCDGDTTTRLFHGVVQINVRTLAGRDLVHYDLLNNVSSLHGLNVDLGAGNDRFVTFLNQKDLFSGADYRITAFGRTGNDNLAVNFGLDPNNALVAQLSQGLVIPPFVAFAPGSVNFGSTPGADIGLNAIFRLNLDGGIGNDTIGVNYEGTIAGNSSLRPNPFVPALNAGVLAVSVNGGTGNDRITTNILALTGSAGLVRASTAGGVGDDSLTLTVYQQPATSPQVSQAVVVSARLDGGPGTDHCDRTPNVTATGCEFDKLELAILRDGTFAPPFQPGAATQPVFPGTLA
jgi:hypothetical protein